MNRDSLTDLERIEIELNENKTYKKPINERLAHKGFKFNDVLGKPKSHFTKKKKRYKKKK